MTTTVIGYLRVSTEEQADSGAGLSAQRATITEMAAHRGWAVEWVEDAGFSAKDLKRPGITRALDLLRRGRASTLVVAKLDRLSRSVLDFCLLMERSRKERWALVVLDLGVDTSTPAGEMMVTLLATFAQFERRLIAQRTKDALAVKRREGVRLGRPPALPAEVVERILRLRRKGRSFPQIAAELEFDSVPTAHGGTRWHPSTVRSVVNSRVAAGQSPDTNLGSLTPAA